MKSAHFNLGNILRARGPVSRGRRRVHGGRPPGSAGLRGVAGEGESSGHRVCVSGCVGGRAGIRAPQASRPRRPFDARLGLQRVGRIRTAEVGTQTGRGRNSPTMPRRNTNSGSCWRATTNRRRRCPHLQKAVALNPSDSLRPVPARGRSARVGRRRATRARPQNDSKPANRTNSR